MPSPRPRVARRTLFALPGLLAAPALAQSWPTHPIRLIVPFGPGGPTDVVARLLANGLSPLLGQPVVIENRAGAGGNIGVSLAARAAPDGHTLLVASSGFVVNPSLFRNPGYDPIRDFAPISELGASPDVFLANNDSGIATIEALVARGRATAGGLHFAHPGTGTTPHLAGERLAIAARMTIVPVMYPSAPLAVQAVMAGTTQIGATALASAHAQVKANRVRGVAITGPERWFDLPDIPTMLELGYAGFISETFQSFYAPAGTPAAIVQRLVQATTAVMRDSDVQARMRNAGFVVRPDGPEALAARVAREVAGWRELITNAGIAVE